MRCPRAAMLIAAFSMTACSATVVRMSTPTPAAPASPVASAAAPTAATATVAPTVSPTPTFSPSLRTVVPLEGILLFARFDEATHTFEGMFVSRPDGSAEAEVPLPFTEGDGALSRSGEEIAVAMQLADGRIGTAIIDLEGKVLRVLKIPERSLNLPCGLWSFDDARL